MVDREKALQALEHCDLCSDMPNCPVCAYLREPDCMEHLKRDIIALLKAQEPRLMTLEEVEAMPYGHVLIETDKKDSLRWLDALLFSKNTNYSFDFITLEGRVRLLGTEYNREWRCWTSRPTDEQREAEPWN